MQLLTGMLRNLEHNHVRQSALLVMSLVLQTAGGPHLIET
jgi:hypothetical protein